MDRFEDPIYRSLFRRVDGAVRDALFQHPEYLTEEGVKNARRSIVKRVTGTLYPMFIAVEEKNSNSRPCGG